MAPISKECRLQIIPVPNSLAAEIVMAETIERREEAEVTVIDITVKNEWSWKWHTVCGTDAM